MSNGNPTALDPLDTPIHGCEKIARTAGLITSPGQPTKSELRRSYYAIEKLVEKGVVTKFGHHLASTPRRIRDYFGGGRTA